MYEKEKKTINEIIDMNGGRFNYSPTLMILKSRTIIAVYIGDTVSEAHAYVDDWNGDIIARIHDATAKIMEEEAHENENDATV